MHPQEIPYEAVLFDFDGVLSHGRFYSDRQKTEPEIYKAIEREIFSPPSEKVFAWMRGKISSQEINKYLSKKLFLKEATLSEYLKRSASSLELETKLLNFSEDLRRRGLKTGIVTDNMDVFTDVVVPANDLDKKFDVIINSADYGFLKQDKNGRLFEIALSEIDRPSMGRTLLIDDSRGNCRLFRKKGGESWCYKGIVDFPQIKNKLYASRVKL